MDNIDAVLAKHGFNREVEIFSIDVDGIDYWLWEASTVISTRHLIIEYNASFGPETSVAVPYEPSFDRTTKGADGHYRCASITALAKLGAKKGYALLGCDAFGANPFFTSSRPAR